MRIELIAGPTAVPGVFAVQVGVFADRSNAEHLRDELRPGYDNLFIRDLDMPSGHFYRVTVGRLGTPQAAQQLASQLRSTQGLDTFVVRLDGTRDLGIR